MMTSCLPVMEEVPFSLLERVRSRRPCDGLDRDPDPKLDPLEPVSCPAKPWSEDIPDPDIAEPPDNPDRDKPDEVKLELDKLVPDKAEPRVGKRAPCPPITSELDGLMGCVCGSVLWLSCIICCCCCVWCCCERCCWLC